MKSLLRYLRIYWFFCRNVAIETMAYRLNFVLMFVINSGWFAIFLATYAVIFSRVKNLAGWQPFQVVFLAATWQLIFSIFGSVFVTNLTNVSWSIRTGDMDLVLLRPLSPLFHHSFNRIEPGSVMSILTAFPVLIWASRHLPGFHPGLLDLLAYPVLVASGIGMLYSLMLLVVSTAFWSTRVSSVQGLFWSLQEFGGYPAEIYRGGLRWFLTFLVPVAVIANVPARALLKGFDWRMAGVSLGASLALFLVARQVFYMGLGRYRSASS